MIIDTTPTNTTNEVITRIIDKIERNIAHSHWPNADEHIWDFDRIAYLVYIKEHNSDATFNHSIYVRWKRPMGKGTNDPGVLKDIMEEYKGSYYYPGNFGFYVRLWHPGKQAFQESAPPSRRSERIHWRSYYRYSEDEVWSALKILCEHYGWGLKRYNDSGWTIFQDQRR